MTIIGVVVKLVIVVITSGAHGEGCSFGKEEGGPAAMMMMMSDIPLLLQFIHSTSYSIHCIQLYSTNVPGKGEVRTKKVKMRTDVARKRRINERRPCKMLEK